MADINECDIAGTCQHNCTNLDGSFLCSCPSGYRLNPNKRTCDGQFGSGDAADEFRDRDCFTRLLVFTHCTERNHVSVFIRASAVYVYTVITHYTTLTSM